MPNNPQILQRLQPPLLHQSPLHHPPHHLLHFHHLVIPTNLQLLGPKFSRCYNLFVPHLISTLMCPPTFSLLLTPSPPHHHLQLNLSILLQIQFQFHTLHLTLQVPLQLRPLRKFALLSPSTKISPWPQLIFSIPAIQLMLNLS